MTMENDIRAVYIGLAFLVSWSIVPFTGCIASKGASARVSIEDRLSLFISILRVSEIDWRIPSESSNEILDEWLFPIKEDPQSLADLCIFIMNLHEQEGGVSEKNHSFFLESLKWHAVSAICKCQSKDAEKEFKRLQPIIGRDGAESLLFKEYEDKYFSTKQSVECQ